MTTMTTHANELAGRSALAGAATRTAAAEKAVTAEAMPKDWEEMWRRIHTSLNLQTLARQSGIISVTSAHEGEGKTTVALGLAQAMARDLERDILLLDCNPFRPGLSRFSRPGAGTGSDELSGGASAARCHLSPDPAPESYGCSGWPGCTRSVETASVEPDGRAHGHLAQPIRPRDCGHAVLAFLQRYPGDRLVFAESPVRGENAHVFDRERDQSAGPGGRGEEPGHRRQRLPFGHTTIPSAALYEHIDWKTG